MKNDYQLVKYNGNSYYVFSYNRDNNPSGLFVVDKEDLNKVLDMKHTWYKVSDYVGTNILKNNVKTAHYLHNVIMDVPTGGGKGQKITVDHINRITHDNRKSNLRIVSQSQQNCNQKRRGREITLPKKCGVTVDQIPKCVWYKPVRGAHGEAFVLEMTLDGKRETHSSTNQN